jgi:hypothetical protein
MDNLAARTEKRAKLKQFLRENPKSTNDTLKARFGANVLLFASVREELRLEGVEVTKPRKVSAARAALATTRSPITQRLDEKPVGRIESPQERERNASIGYVPPEPAVSETAIVIAPKPRPKLTTEDEEILRDVVTTMDKANEADALRAQVADLDAANSELAEQLEAERAKNTALAVVPESGVEAVDEEDTRDSLIEWYEQREIDLCKAVAELTLELMQLKTELAQRG